MSNLLTVSARSGDVEAMMHSVATELEQWAALHGVGTAANQGVENRDTPTRDLVRRLRLDARVDGNAIIHSTRPRLGPWLIRFQTAVRRLTWWFIEPVLQQVRAFQLESAQAIEQLAQEQEILRAQVSELRVLVGRTEGALNNDQLEQRGCSGNGGTGDA